MPPLAQFVVAHSVACLIVAVISLFAIPLLSADLLRIGTYPLAVMGVRESVCVVRASALQVREHARWIDMQCDVCTCNGCRHNVTWNEKIGAVPQEFAEFEQMKRYYAGARGRCYSDGMRTAWTLAPWQSTFMTGVQAVAWAVCFLAYALIVVGVVFASVVWSERGVTRVHGYESSA